MGFATALSGLKASSTNLQVTGNNIANSQTTGFKQSRADFADVYVNSLGDASRTTAGVGVRTSSVTQQFKQGNIEPTSNSLDLAISGDGFFSLSDDINALDPSKPVEPTAYTRNGAFELDKDGNVVDGQGRFLLAFKANGLKISDGFSLGVKQPVKIDSDQGIPNATANVNMRLNLNAAAKPAQTPFAIDPVTKLPDPKTFNNSTSLTTYDSQGNAHIATTYFARTSDPGNVWKAYTFIDGRGISVNGQNDSLQSPPVYATPSTVEDEGIPPQPTILHFDSFGALQEPSDAESAVSKSIAASVAAIIGTEKSTNDNDYKGDATLVTADDIVAAVKAGEIAATDAAQKLVDDINDVTKYPDATELQKNAAAANLEAVKTAAAAAVAAAESHAVNANLEPPTETVADVYAAVQFAMHAGIAAGIGGEASTRKIDFGGINLKQIDPNLNVEPLAFSVDLTGTTQLSNPFSVNNLNQDGLPTGTLTGVDVDKTGVIYAKYSNGSAKPLGQVALARFTSPTNLAKLGDTSWGATAASGVPIFGAAGDNNFGNIQSSAIENSNVDLSEQLVKLIVAQQAYQANSQTVSTEKAIIETILRV